LGQLYKLAADLEVDPAILDEYLAVGLTLSELKHTANIANQLEVAWTEIAEFRANADSWGDIKQAYNMADGITAAEILIFGVQEYKEFLRVADKETREIEQELRQEERNQQIANKLAEKYPDYTGNVMLLFNEGECEGNWGCVRKALREEEKAQAEGLSDRGLRTATQISIKYGYSEELVIAHYNGLCSEDWACTRTYFRENSLIIKKTGKPEK
jgi:hypothetical protein